MLKSSFFALALVLGSSLAVAQDAVQYEVFITNVTPGQTFTPQFVVTHPGNVELFRLGQAASVPLEILAEGGDTGPLTDEVANVATDVQTIGGLLGPGQTVQTVVMGSPEREFISIAAMLIPTNDTFVAMNRMRLPAADSRPVQMMVPAYDAGTEVNDQSCQNIPGPRCGGEGYSDEPGEGFVYIGNGFHDLGDEDADGFEVLGPQQYDWRNAVAKIVVRPLIQ